MQYRGEEKSSKDKFIQIKKGIVISKEEKYDLTTLIKASKMNGAKVIYSKESNFTVSTEEILKKVTMGHIKI